MARKPEFPVSRLTDNTMLAVLQGNNQDSFPIRFGTLKSSIVSANMQVGSFLYTNPDPLELETQTVSFSSNLDSANAIVAFILPNEVNYDPSTLNVTTGGFTVDMLGGLGDGTEAVGYIAAVITS